MPLLLLLCGSCCKDKDFPFKFQFSAEWVFMLQILRFLLLFCPKKQEKSEKGPLSGNRKRCCHSAKMSSQNCRKKSSEFLNCLRWNRRFFYLSSSRNLKSRPKWSPVSEWKLQNGHLPTNWCMYSTFHQVAPIAQNFVFNLGKTLFARMNIDMGFACSKLHKVC